MGPSAEARLGANGDADLGAREERDVERVVAESRAQRPLTADALAQARDLARAVGDRALHLGDHHVPLVAGEGGDDLLRSEAGERSRLHDDRDRRGAHQDGLHPGRPRPLQDVEHLAVQSGLHPTPADHVPREALDPGAGPPGEAPRHQLVDGLLGEAAVEEGRLDAARDVGARSGIGQAVLPCHAPHRLERGLRPPRARGTHERDRRPRPRPRACRRRRWRRRRRARWCRQGPRYAPRPRRCSEVARGEHNGSGRSAACARLPPSLRVRFERTKMMSRRSSLGVAFLLGLAASFATAAANAQDGHDGRRHHAAARSDRPPGA